MEHKSYKCTKCDWLARGVIKPIKVCPFCGAKTEEIPNL